MTRCTQFRSLSWAGEKFDFSTARRCFFDVPQRSKGINNPFDNTLPRLKQKAGKGDNIQQKKTKRNENEKEDKPMIQSKFFQSTKKRFFGEKKYKSLI